MVELNFDPDWQPDEDDWNSLLEAEPEETSAYVSPQDLMGEDEWMDIYYGQVREDLLAVLIRDERNL